MKKVWVLAYKNVQKENSFYYSNRKDDIDNFVFYALICNWDVNPMIAVCHNALTGEILSISEYSAPIVYWNT